MSYTLKTATLSIVHDNLKNLKTLDTVRYFLKNKIKTTKLNNMLLRNTYIIKRYFFYEIQENGYFSLVQTDVIRAGNSDVNWLIDSWLSIISLKRTNIQKRAIQGSMMGA